VNPRRGEVWIVDFGNPVGREQSGRRPLVIVLADLLNDSRAGAVMVVRVTRTPRDLPSHVEIDVGRSGLNEMSYAKCEDVKSVCEQRLAGRLGAVDEQVMLQIGRILRFLLDL
jgi:mRNA interferase MazF